MKQIGLLIFIITQVAVAFFLSMLLITMFVSSAEAGEPKAIYKVAEKEGIKHGIDPRLIMAVIEVESNFKTTARGTAGEIGLMQLHPRFFPDATADVKQNIEIGAKHLAYSRANCPTKTDLTWVNCYNLGTNQRLKFPKQFPYYKKIISAYKRRLPTGG